MVKVHTSKKTKTWSRQSKRFLAKNTLLQKKLQYSYGHFCKKDVPILSQVSPYWVKLFSKRVLINPPQFCFVLSRRSRQVPAFYILWSLTCFVIILAFFPTIFQLELWPLGLLSNYLYHFFFWICLCSSQICKILCCVWSWKMIELKQSIEALNSCGVLSCILFRT